jgi:hypothetical protein
MVPLAYKAVAFCYKVSLFAPLGVIVTLAGKAVAICNKVSLLASLHLMVQVMVPVADCVPVL